MITQKLWEALCGLVAGFFDILPIWDLSLPPFPQDWGNTIGGALSIFNNYVPLPVLVMCLLFLVALRLLFGGWRLIVFIYHQIWGAN